VKTRRVTVIGFSVLVAAGLALTACSSKGTPTTAAPLASGTATATGSLPSGAASGLPTGTATGASTGATAAPSASTGGGAPPASPTAALASALSQLKSLSYNFTQVEGVVGKGDYLSGSGSYNAAHKSAAGKFQGSQNGIKVQLDLTQVSSKIWVKMIAGEINKELKLPSNKWMLASASQIDPGKSPFDLSGSSDVLNIAKLMTTVGDLKMADASTLTGTVDLTAAIGDNAPDPDELATVGISAKKTPFTATLDSQGRLTALKINSTDKLLIQTFTFSSYGSPSKISAPSGASKAPATLYEFFND
jgi:hypothetical protein